MLLRTCVRPLARTAAAGASSPLLRTSNKAVTAQVLPRALLSTAGKESYSDRQAKTGRPVSPHVTIFKFPIAALTSIVTRVTGGALGVGLAGISVMALGGVDVAGVMSSIGTSSLGAPAKVLFAFPLVYHYGGAMRHFLWDRNPDMLYNKGVTEASYILVGSTVALSLAAGAITLSPAEKEEKGKK